MNLTELRALLAVLPVIITQNNLAIILRKLIPIATAVLLGGWALWIYAIELNNKFYNHKSTKGSDGKLYRSKFEADIAYYSNDFGIIFEYEKKFVITSSGCVIFLLRLLEDVFG